MKAAGAIIAAIGVIIILISAFADPIGIGGEDSGFGWKQIIGVVVGAIVVIAGLVIAARTRAQPGAGATPDPTGGPDSSAG